MIRITQGPRSNGHFNASIKGGRSSGGFHSTRISSADKSWRRHCATKPSNKCCIRSSMPSPWSSLREVAMTLIWNSRLVRGRDDTSVFTEIKCARTSGHTLGYTGGDRPPIPLSTSSRRLFLAPVLHDLHVIIRRQRTDYGKFVRRIFEPRYASDRIVFIESIECYHCFNCAK